MGTLVQLVPHGPIRPHVPVIEVWGTLLEVNCHLLHVHSSIRVPPRPPYILGAIGSPDTNLLQLVGVSTS